MRRYFSPILRGLLLLSLLISIISISAFDTRAIVEGFAQSFFGPRQYREFIYVMTMPILLVVGLIIELVIFTKKKRIFYSFIYSGCLSLIVIIGVSYWFLLSLEDGLALIGVLGMSMTAFAVISFIQLFVLFVIKQRQK